MKKICAIIPAYNVEQTISDVIEGVKQFLPVEHIIVVDDGSTDSTSKIAGQCGAVVLTNQKNQGKGFTLKKGYEFALKNSYDAVLCLDGDMQHAPEDVPKFLETFHEKKCDLVLGSRMSDLSTMPLDRQFSNQTTSLIISLFTGQRVRDSQSGYRLISTSVLKSIKLNSHKYETESELLVKALKNKFKISHVPIQTIYNDQPSHIHRLVDTLRFVRIVIHSLIFPN